MGSYFSHVSRVAQIVRHLNYCLGAPHNDERRGAAAGGGWAGGKAVRAPLMLIEFGPQRVQQARSPGPKPSHSQSNGIELPHQIELQFESAKHSSISVKSKLVLHCFAYDMWEGIPVIELFPSNGLTCQLQVNLSSSSACQDWHSKSAVFDFVVQILLSFCRFLILSFYCFVVLSSYHFITYLNALNATAIGFRTSSVRVQAPPLPLYLYHLNSLSIFSPLPFFPHSFCQRIFSTQFVFAI